MKDNLFSITQISGYKNMPDIIAEALKESILHGKLKGGMQLKQDEIAKQFDASLIPVREALIQLEGRGLVKSIRNKGTVVTTLSVEEMQQLFQVRKMLEVGVVRNLGEDIDEELLSKMKYVMEKMKEEKDLFILARYNRLFHELLCDMAHNKQLSQIYQNLFVRVERYLMYIYHFSYDKEKELEGHTKMIGLLEEKKMKGLDSCLMNHIGQAENDFLAYLKKEGLMNNLDWNQLLTF